MIICLLLNLVFLQEQTIASPPEIQWLQSGLEVEAEAKLNLQLFIPKSASLDTVRVDFTQGGKALISWTGIVVSDTLIPIEVGAGKAGGFKVTAIVYSLRKQNSKKALAVIPSQLFTIRKDESELLTYLPNLITTIIAFVAGALTFFLQKVFEGKLKRKELRAEAEKAFIKHLLPELGGHKKELQEYVSGKSARLKVLETIGYNNLLGTSGFATYLDNRTRKTFFSRIEEYYDKEVFYFNVKINTFNSLPPEERSQQTGTMKSETNAMIDKINKLTSGS